MNTSLKIVTISLLLLMGSIFLVAFMNKAPDTQTDAQLRALLKQHNVTPLQALEFGSDAEVALGRLLFFDPILSGNKDVSCATCHHPDLATGDGLALPIGVGGRGLGRERQADESRVRVPRNATELFNRGVSGWHTMFWDGRVSELPDGSFVTPAGVALPDGLNSLLAVQAIFPVTSRDEMRGLEGDVGVLGEPNELAAFSDYDWTGMWDALVARLLTVPAYQALFKEAYPDVTDVTIAQVGNAIAAFEASAWTFLDSPFDRYLAGDDAALTDTAKQGALLFYGEAGCVSCHSGSLLTDQQHHNLAVPPLGPGKNGGLIDYGRGMLSMQFEDRFCFRTPPLRNVTLSAPYMHNGAYNTLEDVIKHHLNPEQALRNYDTAQLELSLRATVRLEDELVTTMLETLDEALVPREVSDAEVRALVAFLEALTSPSATQVTQLEPDAVPSGLSVTNP